MKTKNVITYITEELKFSSDDSDKFDEEWIKIKHCDGFLFKESKFKCAKSFFKTKNIAYDLPNRKNGHKKYKDIKTIYLYNTLKK